MSTTPGVVQLDFTELCVVEWPVCVAWYREVLGLKVVLLDEERCFALLEGGGGRLSLKGSTAENASKGVRLVFRVDNVAATRAWLASRGESVSPLQENEREGYREVRSHDPEGTLLTFYEWAARTKEIDAEGGIPEAID